MPFLNAGKILHVDLTDGTVRTQPTRAYADRYIGGRAINAALVYDLVDPDTDALGPGNVLALGVGPLGGTSYPGCSRLDVMAKSPVTNLLGDSNMGGYWAAELKYAGYDHLVLHGRAEKPVYVWIHNDDVELRDATALLGKTTWDAQQAVLDDLDNPNVKVISIGPAGEHLVTWADLHQGTCHAAARTGMGAVMGSKNVKAIAVRGTQGIKVADPEAMMTACLEAHTAIRASEMYGEYSTVGTSWCEASYGRAGIECGGDGHEGPIADWDPHRDQAFDQFWVEYGLKRTGCMGCPVHCMETYYVPGVGSASMSCELYTQTAGELRQDLLRGIKLVKLCQEMGIDETSVSNVLQWLLVLKDMGVIDDSHLDDVPLAWGDVDSQVEFTRRIIFREGVGDVFADGLLAAAKHLDAHTQPGPRGGASTYEYAMQVNNNPMYGINPRVKSMALAYAVGRRSDCISDLNMQDFDIMSVSAEYPGWTDEQRHEAAEFDAETARYVADDPRAADFDVVNGKAIIVHDMGRTVGMADMAGTCKQHMKWLYLNANPAHMAAAISAGVGKTVTGDDLMWASLQLRTLERALECKWGRRREHDTIPEKEFGKLVSQGVFKGKSFTSREDLEAMKDEYYWLRGWDRETGIPYGETLRDFGLHDVAADLEKLGILPACTDEQTRRAGIAKASTLGYVWPELVGRDDPGGNKAPWAADEPEAEAPAAAAVQAAAEPGQS